MRLGGFSYLVLALIGPEGAGPHDLVRRARPFGGLWAAHESHYHVETARLAQAGYLTSYREPGRTRPRTHYLLTHRGNTELQAWLGKPIALPRLQHPALGHLLARAPWSQLEASIAGFQELLSRARAQAAATSAEPGERLACDLELRLLAAQQEWAAAAVERVGAG